MDGSRAASSNFFARDNTAARRRAEWESNRLRSQQVLTTLSTIAFLAGFVKMVEAAGVDVRRAGDSLSRG